MFYVKYINDHTGKGHSCLPIMGRGTHKNIDVSSESTCRIFQGDGAYRSYNSQRQGSSGRYRQRQSGGTGSRAGRRRAVTRRRSRVTDRVSRVAGGHSAPQSRQLEISQYNDTVYEINGKRRYSYYWKVNVSIESISCSSWPTAALSRPGNCE